VGVYKHMGREVKIKSGKKIKKKKISKNKKTK